MFLPRIAALAGLLSILRTNAAPLQKRDLKPVITTDFPDPSIIKVGSTWYAFASQSDFQFTDIKVQLATSQDLKSWALTGKDALGTLGSWAVRDSRPKVWAPSVSKREDGSFLMYYSAITTTAGNGLLHCVGTATSKNPEGPYESNSDEPFACPTDQGGALDASFFKDEKDGKNYALYKIDANALGNGGVCGNTVAPIKTTPIMIQEVQPDETTKIGSPSTLLTNSEIDGPLVEAPYMVRTSEGIYVLFFSSNCWTTDLYDVSYATSTSPLGPFVKSKVSLMVTGTQGMIGPGGASISEDGKTMVLHGYSERKLVGSIRSLYVVPVEFQGREVLV